MPISSEVPLVSVLVQTYRQEAFISTCLEGIVKQETNFLFEICLGVDTSEDCTEAICWEYAEKYPEIVRLFVRDPKDKVVLFGQPIGRYNFTQNLLAARGKYVAIIEGDDYWTDMTKLAKQVNFLEGKPGASFVCTNRQVLREGSLAPDSKLDIILDNNSNEPFEITEHNFFSDYCVSTCTCMFRNSFFDPNLVKEFPTSFKDVFLFFSLLMLGSAYLMPEVTTVYRIHEGGTWSLQPPLRKVRAETWTFREMNKSWLGKSSVVKNRYTSLLKSYALVALKKGAFKDIVRAVKWGLIWKFIRRS
jgi:glycosyltransferase involved in cell wall biosynthesis